MQRHSFPPAARADARVLILGSMPGEASLRAQQYYAHPYAERLRRLHARGVAVWDVLAYCERPGSLDGAIVRLSEVANDLATFRALHPQLQLICLNGGKAAEAFTRHVMKSQPDFTDGLRVVALPSTSPANAGQPAATKLASWRAALQAAVFVTPVPEIAS